MKVEILEVAGLVPAMQAPPKQESDPIGITIGDYRIVEYLGIVNQRRMYKCVCLRCGHTKIMQKAEFMRGKFIHSGPVCGEDYMKSEIGKIYGDFIIESYNKDWSYNCRCLICGLRKKLIYNKLHNNIGISHSKCSYLLNDGSKEYDKFHKLWSSMRGRTRESRRARDPYGIYDNVHSDEYASFVDFYKDFYEAFLKALETIPLNKISIDRIDGSKDYTRDNIRFADPKMQSRNTKRIKNCIGISPDGTIYDFRIIQDFADEHGLDRVCISNCLKQKTKTHKGWRFKYAENN